MKTKIFFGLIIALTLVNTNLKATLESEVKDLRNQYQQQKKAIEAVVIGNPELKRHWQATLATIKHAMRAAQDMYAAQFRGADPYQGALMQAKVQYEAALKMMITERLIVENMNDLSNQLNEIQTTYEKAIEALKHAKHAPEVPKIHKPLPVESPSVKTAPAISTAKPTPKTITAPAAHRRHASPESPESPA